MRTRIAISAVVAAVVLSGCLPSSGVRRTLPDPSAVKLGMTEDRVIDLMGEPLLVDPYQVGKYIFFYPRSETSDCINDRSSCTQVLFQEGRVIRIGSRGRAPSADRVDLSARAAADRPAPIDEETRREIERLERQVRQIPAARTMDNLRIYRYLLKLDPGSARYRQKVSRYEAQYRREQDQREDIRRQREEQRKKQNELLRRFEGNDQVRLALENQGNGRFYVWLQYSGSAAIDISPDHFALVCENSRRYPCYRCRDMEVRLEPGGSAEGRVSFDTYAQPSQFVFSHPAAGTVSRRFPKP